MRTPESDSLKSRINNFAKNAKLPPQIVLQNYMFEQFLARLSQSPYKDNFILKGGLLMSSIAGLQTRTTKDMDITIKNIPLSESECIRAMTEISDIDLNDNIVFRVISSNPIRDDDPYGGLRIRLKAHFYEVEVDLSIDVSTGDIITPKETEYRYKRMFENDSFPIMGYTLETILAEKIETVLSRSVFNTRMKDFYDIYIILSAQTIDMDLFHEALQATSAHRNSLETIKDSKPILDVIQNNKEMQNDWKRYQMKNDFATDIVFDQIIQTIRNALLT